MESKISRPIIRDERTILLVLAAQRAAIARGFEVRPTSDPTVFVLICPDVSNGHFYPIRKTR